MEGQLHSSTGMVPLGHSPVGQVLLVERLERWATGAEGQADEARG